MWARRVSKAGDIGLPSHKEEVKAKKVRARAKPKNKLDTSDINANEDTVLEGDEDTEHNQSVMLPVDEINKNANNLESISEENESPRFPGQQKTV